MPGATRYEDRDRAVYQVSRRSFVFFRTPRPDAFDPETGERYDDVIVFWVESEEDKQALVLDESTPFFSTPHFDGHPSVLLRGSRIGELSLEELTEVVQDAWLARAGKRARAAWLAEHPSAVSQRPPGGSSSTGRPSTGPDSGTPSMSSVSQSAWKYANQPSRARLTTRATQAAYAGSAPRPASTSAGWSAMNWSARASASRPSSGLPVVQRSTSSQPRRRR